MAKLLFPGFKSKALTFSYDDNTTQDRRLTEIFRKYGLAATFNINTGSFGSIGHLDNHGGFYCEYNRINESEAGELYRGFEVASLFLSRRFWMTVKKSVSFAERRRLGLRIPAGAMTRRR